MFKTHPTRHDFTRLFRMRDTKPPTSRCTGETYQQRPFLEVIDEFDPWLALFGLFLSTRIDLLSDGDRELLSTIPDHGRPVPFSEMADSVSQGLGHPLKNVFQAVDPDPCESRLLFNSYEALLHTGEEVFIRVRRPKLENFVK